MLLATLLLAGCSVAYVPPPKQLPPITEPTVAPTFATSRGEAAGNVECPTTVGSAAGYTLFGAAAADFNAGHPGSSLLLRCATDLKVIVIQLDQTPPVTAAQALARAERELPADVKQVYDKSDAGCGNLQFQSRTLATQLGADDPDGVVNIELESALATNQKYDPQQVDTVVIHQQYDLNQVRPCIRG
jgi:hypothetical protein